MTQYGYEPLSPSDSGSTLLERVNGVMPALVTNHKGPARPGYVQPGMMWIDDSGSEWLLNLYDGISDALVATINPADHTVQPAGRTSEISTPFGFAATAGQTVFALGMSPSPNACIVSQNGAWLTSGVDYVIAGSTLTLSTAAEAGDRISGLAIGSFEVANAMLPAANLADLADKATARGNLGLGSAAVENAGTGANRLLKLDASGKIPAIDGSQLTNLPLRKFLGAQALAGLVNVDKAIPAGANRVIVGLNGVSVSGGSVYLRVGNSGGVVASGYTGNYGQRTGEAAFSTQFNLGISAGIHLYGIVYLERMHGNLWCCSFTLGAEAPQFGGGIIDVGDTLTLVRLFGSAAFTSGTVYVCWE